MDERLKGAKEAMGEFTEQLRLQPINPSSTPKRDELAADLVQQNYDRLFALVDETWDVSLVDRTRLIALAALNVGDLGTAQSVLASAEDQAREGPTGAHICYLQGLVAAKREYDLRASDAHHRRGLSHLGSVKDDESSLERAWLFNGLALNNALYWRRNPGNGQYFRQAFEQVQAAFSLIRSLNDAPAAYLRFNLIANTTFLLEMRGAYTEAAQTFERAFNVHDQDIELSTTLMYRIGTLWLRAGDLHKARLYLCRAATGSAGDWWSHEVVLRALGALEYASGRVSQAVDQYLQGARCSIDARARRGSLHHVKSIQNIAPGSTVEQECVQELLQSGVLRQELDTYQPLALPSKLPAYVPEIDLESLPVLDLNRFLGQGATSCPVEARDHV
jgi:tetratricopeptide (TPR) repeat protein